MQDNYRPANWMASGYTPGAPNSGLATLPAFQPVWINELLSVNTNGITDNFGEHEPWIELFNNGSSPINLNGLFLTDNYSNLTAWPFPSTATIGAGQFLVIWADGQPQQTTALQWHTSFRLNSSSGSLALVRTNGIRAEVLDYVNYPGLSPNHAFGSIPDGQPQTREILFYPTPGASNNPAAPPVPVIINEWMASNAGPGGYADPADGLFQDWFELYNPNTNAVDLSGYYLTDTLADPTKWQIPANTFISGKGFLLVWADNNTIQNGTGSDLHANFQLSAGGEEIGLFSPDGTPQSTVVFGQQFENVSQGLFPDGNTNSIYFMTSFTPRAANTLQSGPPPQITQFSVAPNGLVTLIFNITAGKTYQVEFKDDLQLPTWSPLGSSHFALDSTVTVFDNIAGHTQRFYRVVVLN